MNKFCAVLFTLIIGLAILLLCSGCETYTDEEGITRTRFDAKSFGAAVDTVGNTYERYHRLQQPAYNQSERYAPYAQPYVAQP